MPSPARRAHLLFIFLAATWFVACSSNEIQPEPTPTKTPPPTFTPLATQSLQTATPMTTSLAVAGTPRAGAAQIPKPVPKDPYLPVFGPFPPLPIPSRPSNINPLTGLAANPSALERRPLLVRIGNDEKPRTEGWQAGFSSADIVFEELIDILGSAYANTRFTAIFLANDPPLIGPVRSGRLINLQLAPMLDGALAHAGASNGTRWLFSQTPMTNLDEYFNQPAYCYILSHGYQGRLYTSGSRLREWLAHKKWEEPIPLFGFQFSDAAPAGAAATAIGFTKAPWPKWDQAEWRYDAAKGLYMRFVTGAPQTDNSYSITAKWGNGANCVAASPVTKAQVQATNVVVLYARHDKTNIVEDSNNSVSVYISLTGQGDAQFFRDGVTVKGKWQRRSEQEFFQFSDASGKPFSLKPGNTWFEIVPLGYSADIK
jgi:hypothetical protein